MTLKQNPKTRNRIFLSLLVYLGFSGLTYLSNFNDLWLSLVTIGMLLLPPIWAWRIGNRKEMGFTTTNLRNALLWGLAGGLVSAGVGVLVIGKIEIPPDLPLQLAVAVPMWLLVASPFQEFFFRGWLQSRLEAAMGEWPGLLAALACFTLWHFTLPIFGPQSIFPMFTLQGILGTIASGLIYSYLFWRTRSLFAPSLAHALAGIAFVVIGAATFLPGS